MKENKLKIKLEEAKKQAKIAVSTKFVDPDFYKKQCIELLKTLQDKI